MTEAQADSRWAIDLFTREQQWVTDTSSRAFESSMDQWHKILLLAAGILGVVVPLMASNPRFANPAWMRVASFWLVACIVVGVIGVVVSRYLFIALTFFLGTYYRRLTQAAASQDDAALARAEAWRVKLINRWKPYFALLVLVGDVAFYGCLIVGLVEMAVAVTGK